MNAIATRIRAGTEGNLIVRLLPLAVALVVPFVVNVAPAWLLMWLTAGAIWVGCKCAVGPAFADLRTMGVKSFVAWWLWPGMDPKPFVQPRRIGPVAAVEWLQAIGCALIGSILFLAVAPESGRANGLNAGWVAWAGIILFLHFGVFHVMALVLRLNGVAVRPLMADPVGALTVAEFWGQRWNHAFQEVSHRLLFAPLARVAGPRWAILAVFFVSGLVHELVITVPARGGYGLPTLYFVIQGGALLTQKSRWARGLGLDEGWRARAFTLITVAVPVVALFPPQFLRAVILPFVSDVASLFS